MANRRASLIFVVGLIGLVFFPVSVTGQMVVSDPTNLVQNTMAAVSQAQQVAGQIQEIHSQIQQVQSWQRNLEQLSPDQFATMVNTFRRLDELYAEAHAISMEWEQIQDQYEELYGTVPSSREDYESYREEWSEQTHDSIRSAMQSHGVIEAFEERRTNLEGYADAAESAEGVLSALQAGAKMSELLAEQQMEMTEVIVADSRAMMSFMREEKALREADQARVRERMLRGWGEFEARDTPSELPEFE